MREIVKKANETALAKLKNAAPYWVDVRSAGEALGIDKHTLLHAGPPITWEKMCQPMRGAVVAVLKYEGLAANDEEAWALAESGKIRFEPCHHYHAVGPMTGVTSCSMPLICVENKENGNFSFSTFNEGAGDVIRFGAYGENTVRRLKWIEEVFAPVMKAYVQACGGINLKSLIAQSLNMGDELHMRNAASTNLFLKTIISGLLESCEDLELLRSCVRFITVNNDQFFLNFAMAANKSAADAAHGVPYSTLVTAMARNGVEIGIRVSGLGEEWFTAPAAEVEGLYFSGYTAADANKDIGDSAIMETGGVGGMAMAAAPAIVRFLGAGKYADALGYTASMYEICAGESEQYTIPNLDFRGSPIGIDIAKVIDTGITPVINTAIVSKEAGVGMVGAGVSRAPMAMFEQALLAYGKTYMK
jgi:hypothetical protein